MYAVRDRDTKKWFNGMDLKYDPPRQKLSRKHITVWNTRDDAERFIPRSLRQQFEICTVSFRAEDYYYAPRWNEP